LQLPEKYLPDNFSVQYFSKFQIQMTSNVYTPASIQSYINSYNIDTLSSAIFGLFCIFVILRYSASTIENSFRFHLLNIAISILLSDLYVSVGFRPYSIFPVNGVCVIGAFNERLMRWMQADTMFTLELVSDIKMLRRYFFFIILGYPEYIFACKKYSYLFTW
jgi:hypothetical protein